eukprot:bmy_06488T0
MSRVLWGQKEPRLEEGDGQRRLWVGTSLAESRMNVVRRLEGTEDEGFLLGSIPEHSGWAAVELAPLRCNGRPRWSRVLLPSSASTVIETLSRLSRTPVALATGISETRVEDEEGLYDCVYGEDEGGEVYEDLMKAEEAHQPKCPENDIRSCCLAEIKQTEEKYTETLESIEKYFMAPLKRFLTAAEFDSVFINIPELVKVHRNLMQEIHDSIVNKNDQNLYQVFINYKERLVIYGQYCSGVESAISSLDYISKTKEDVKLKLEECSKRANNGKFTLRDLLVVPMQRELVKHTTDPVEKANLKLALDAMKDLAQYVNEVKRDNETLREIKQFQLSIENLNQPVLLFGRPQGDGEIRITTLDKHTKQERHIFLFDLAVIVCKRKGDNYEMKEIIDLQQYKIANNPTTDKENKKWKLNKESSTDLPMKMLVMQESPASSFDLEDQCP